MRYGKGGTMRVVGSLRLFSGALLLVALCICATAPCNAASTETYTILMCAPDQLLQGTTNATITLITEKPLPQKTLDEFLYSSIFFTNPGIHVKNVSFKNALAITCVIDIDRDAPVDAPNNPVDVEILSYDEDGIPILFHGKGMFTLNRQPFVEEIVVDTPSGNIVKGESARLVLRGKNFVIGKVGILLMWSGIPPLYTDCWDTHEVVLNIPANTTRIISSNGRVGVYFYNSDGSAHKADVTVDIQE